MSFMLKGLEVKKIKPKAPRNIFAGPVVEPLPEPPVAEPGIEPATTAGPKRGRKPKDVTADGGIE